MHAEPHGRGWIRPAAALTATWFVAAAALWPSAPFASAQVVPTVQSTPAPPAPPVQASPTVPSGSLVWATVTPWGGATSTPEATATPAASPTSATTARPGSTATPGTATPGITATAGSTPSVGVPATPGSTGTPGPAGTPGASATPDPFATPGASMTPGAFRRLSTGKVGLVALPLTSQVTAEEADRALAAARTGGAQVYSGGYLQWAEVELAPGVYHWHGLDRVYAALDRQPFDFDVAVDIGAVIGLSYNSLSIPADIRFSSFTEPAFVDRYKRFIDEFLKLFGSKTDYLLLHSEGAEEYFSAFPERLSDYCTFMSEAVKHVRQQQPHIKIGIGTHYYDRTEILHCLNRETDFYSFIVNPDFGVQGRLGRAEDTGAVLTQALERARPKKVVIQDGGYPSSSRIGSSDAEQATFVREAFRVLTQHRQQIEYFSYYALTDEDRERMRTTLPGQLPGATAETLEMLMEYISTFGLMTTSGQPKAGWQEWNRQVRQYYATVP